jgi:hypothetical protein
VDHDVTFWLGPFGFTARSAACACHLILPAGQGTDRIGSELSLGAGIVRADRGDQVVDSLIEDDGIVDVQIAPYASQALTGGTDVEIAIVGRLPGLARGIEPPHPGINVFGDLLARVLRPSLCAFR